MNNTIKTSARRDQRTGRRGYRGYVTVHHNGRKLYGIHTNGTRLTRDDAIADADYYAQTLREEAAL